MKRLFTIALSVILMITCFYCSADTFLNRDIGITYSGDDAVNYDIHLGLTKNNALVVTGKDLFALDFLGKVSGIEIGSDGICLSLDSLYGMGLNLSYGELVEVFGMGAASLNAILEDPETASFSNEFDAVSVAEYLSRIRNDFSNLLTVTTKGNTTIITCNFTFEDLWKQCGDDLTKLLADYPEVVTAFIKLTRLNTNRTLLTKDFQKYNANEGFPDLLISMHIVYTPGNGNELPYIDVDGNWILEGTRTNITASLDVHEGFLFNMKNNEETTVSYEGVRNETGDFDLFANGAHIGKITLKQSSSPIKSVRGGMNLSKLLNLASKQS